MSSGRSRTRNRGDVEQSLRVDIRRLRQLGFIRPGAHMSGVWRWTCCEEPSGSILISVDLSDPRDGIAKLSFTANGQPRSQRIKIESRPCRFGGQRFYFVCPRTGRRCEILCGVGGYFACRQFHRLTYISQSEDPLERLYRARSKARARALGEDRNRRPRGANRRRLMDRWNARERAADHLFRSESIRRFGLALCSHRPDKEAQPWRMDNLS